MKSKILTVDNNGVVYTCLTFICPGCMAGEPKGLAGLHMLPVNCEDVHQPSWTFDGNLELPTLLPSILSRNPFICHSFLNAGVFEFLSDSEHPLAGQKVPIPDLPDWVVNES